MASSHDFVLRSLLDNESRRDLQTNFHPEHLEELSSHAGELKPGLLEGYAAIDPGSTGTRAVIAFAKIDKTTRKRKLVDIHRIQDFREDDDRDRRTTRGEWSSKCCPFDGPPYHVGYDADSQVKKRTISIKAIPYFRTQDDDGHPFTKALYDYSRSLPSEIEKEHFEDVLDGILFDFFAIADIKATRSNQVVQRILSSCKAAGAKLCSLALCVPQTWSKRETLIQDYLGPILDGTVASKDVEKTFALEAQCQAQHLITRYPQELRDYDELMVLDFGGHSMGGSHTELHWGFADGRPRFHAPPESDFGVRGGYELWEIGIGKCIDKYMSTNPKRFPQHRRHLIRSHLLDGFFDSKARINLNNPHRLHADLMSDYNDSEAWYTVSITSEQLKQQWESAFREPIDLATKRIRRAATTGRRLKILLTGGSANSRNLRKEIKDVCETLREQGFNVTCSVVAKELDVVLAPKWSIAEGAACCLATAMDVEEFFDLGAAFGLQTLETEEESASGQGKLLFFKQNGVERHRKIDINVDGSKRNFRIIANPFQVDTKARDTSNSVLVQNSYDILDLVLEYLPNSGGEPKPIPDGRHILEVAEMVYNGREALLVLRIRPHLPHGGRRSKRILKKLAVDGVCDWSFLFDVPLTSCGSSNLVELDIDLVRGRFWKLEGDVDESSLEEQSEVSVELGTPSTTPAKRRRSYWEFMTD